MNEEAKLPLASASSQPVAGGEYEQDALYQAGRIVARVLDPEVRGDRREVDFAEINRSDDLVLPEECEFRKFRLIIQRIEDASRIDRHAPEKGRVLRGVAAEILGYREP